MLTQDVVTFAGQKGGEVMKKLNGVLASFNPPKPLQITELKTRDHVVVYEDEECIILMDQKK